MTSRDPTHRGIASGRRDQAGKGAAWRAERSAVAHQADWLSSIDDGYVERSVRTGPFGDP